MSDKHPHAELMRQYLADQTQEWRWKGPCDPGEISEWSGWFTEPPSFLPENEYEFRPCAAKRPKRMRYPCGTLTFPVPETKEPETGKIVWIAYEFCHVTSFVWRDNAFYKKLLHIRRLHLTREAAEEHAAALAELKLVEVEE